MTNKSAHDDVATAMRHINDAWLAGRIDDLAPRIHPDIVMVFPGFAGRAQGREGFLAGFRDFCENATVEEFRDDEHQIDIVGETAVVALRYEMVYERSGERYRVTGRDVWVFHLQAGTWLAVWRVMLDVEESPA